MWQSPWQLSVKHVLAAAAKLFIALSCKLQSSALLLLRLLMQRLLLSILAGCTISLAASEVEVVLYAEAL